MYTIVRTRRFRNALDREAAYAKQTWGPEHASTHFRQLVNALEQLAEFPHMHTGKPGCAANVGHFMFRRGLLMIYRVDDTGRQVQLIDLLGRDRFHHIDVITRQVR